MKSVLLAIFEFVVRVNKTTKTKTKHNLFLFVGFKGGKINKQKFY